MAAEIEVKNQARLSIARVVRLVIGGIKHRLLRSTLTMAVILLAVAFFMSMLSESVFVKSTGKAVQEAIDDHKAPARQLKVFFAAPSKPIFQRDLAAASAADLKMISLRTGASLETVEQLQQQAARVLTYYSFFDKLDVGKRLSLIGKRRGLEIFTAIAGEKEWAAFKKTLDPMHSVKIPGSTDEFRGFLDRIDAYSLNFNDLHAKWVAKVGEFKALAAETMRGADFESWLRLADDASLASFTSLVIAENFHFENASPERIREYLADGHIQGEILKELNSPEGREKWSTAFRAKHKLDEKLALLGDPRAKEVLAKFAVADVDRIAAKLTYARHLASLSDALQGKTELDSESFLSRRQIFLLAISLVVCMVGIANAMLMSITERFREIATMKCLGATDGFILIQFLIEASIQGLTGGSFGMVIGLVLSFAKNYVIFGNFMVSNINVADVLMAGIFSLLAGVLLSMIASLYPSWSASRMAPMEAMRIE